MSVWRFAEAAIGGPLHPGGQAATRRLLDLAGVGEGTRILDLGCGAGQAVAAARARGAVGLDRDGPVQGDLTALPLADDRFDVAVSECAICLADDLDAALAEAGRVLAPGGRLAVSEVVVEAPVEVPDPLARLCCLEGARPEAELVAALERAGLAVETVQDRSDDLARFRDRVRDRVDVDGLLSALGDDGRWRDAVRRVERAVEEGTIGYVHLLATADRGTSSRDY